MGSMEGGVWRELDMEEDKLPTKFIDKCFTRTLANQLKKEVKEKNKDAGRVYLKPFTDLEDVH